LLTVFHCYCMCIVYLPVPLWYLVLWPQDWINTITTTTTTTSFTKSLLVFKKLTYNYYCHEINHAYKIPVQQAKNAVLQVLHSKFAKSWSMLIINRQLKRHPLMRGMHKMLYYGNTSTHPVLVCPTTVYNKTAGRLACWKLVNHLQHSEERITRVWCSLAFLQTFWYVWYIQIPEVSWTGKLFFPLLMLLNKVPWKPCRSRFINTMH